MPPREVRPRPRSLLRRAERWLVGLVMGGLAFVLERVVLRSIRKGRTAPRPQEPTTITGSGSEISAD